MSRRIKVDDLCYRCRQLPTTEGMTVEEMLNVFYDAAGDVDAASLDKPTASMLRTFEMRTCLALSRTITSGNGCTTCGRKVLDWSKDFM